jgi:pilus assembly protein CpaC
MMQAAGQQPIAAQPPAGKQPAKLPEQLPTPKPAQPGMPGRVRLPYMGQPGAPPSCDEKRGVPTPTSKELEQYNRFVQELIDPRNTIDLQIGRTRLLVLKSAPKRVQMGDETVASSAVISPTELALLGKVAGSTVLNLWFADPANPNKEVVLSYLIRVFPDPQAKARLEAIYKAVEGEINHAFPDSHVCLFLVGDKLVVTGEARDIAEATQIIRIITANAPGQAPGGTQRDVGVPEVSNLPLVAGFTPTGPGLLGIGLRNYAYGIPTAPIVINLLHIPGEQQVMLKVTVAEVNRAAARSIGTNFNITNNQGVTVFANNTGNLFSDASNAFGSGGGVGSTGGTSGTSGAAGSGGATGSGFGAVVTNLTAALNNGNILLAISALRNMNLARSLAEPNLVALNGQTATFQAGGQFPVPAITGLGSSGAGAGNLTGLQGVQFIPFGVLLSFTPYVTDRDRVRLSVAAEVSTRDFSAETSIGGAEVPGLSTRNFQTVVELREGETLAVAGLIQNSFSVDSTRVPFFGDLPFIGRLAAFDTTTAGEQELVVLVTPQLVHPLAHHETAPLPGSDMYEPGDLEFYLWGRLESRRNYDYRSPVRTDLDRMKAYRRCEQVYIYGPHGHTDPPADP